MPSQSQLHRRLPKETKSEVLGATIIETRLEVSEESEQENPEQALTSQYEETDLEPPYHTLPHFPSEKPRKWVEEADLQLPNITEEAQRDSIEEEKTKPYEQTKPEFPDQKPRKCSEEADLESPGETKPRDPGEIQRKLVEERGTELQVKINPEFPEEKSRKPIDETNPGPSEKTTSEVPKQTRKSYEEKISAPPGETGLALQQEIKPDTKSIEEKVLEPLEYTKPTDKKEKQRESSEKIGLATSEKSKLKKTLKEN